MNLTMHLIQHLQIVVLQYYTTLKVNLLKFVTSALEIDLASIKTHTKEKYKNRNKQLLREYKFV